MMIYHYYTITNTGHMEYNFDDKIREDVPLNTLNDTVPFQSIQHVTGHEAQCQVGPVCDNAKN